jgi:hypothetical protein
VAVLLADAGVEDTEVIVDLGERGLRAAVRCSMAIAGDRPSIDSTSGFSICPRNWRA